MKSEIHKAAEILRRGGIVAFPTETVYGLGARMSDRAAVRKIFAAKGRPGDNPLIVHIASLGDLDALAREVPPAARKLADAFWPGPLTLVLKKSARVPDSVTAGLDTVAVRFPSHPVALELIRAAGEPIAAPSANRSGRPTATSSAHVRRELGGRIGMVLSGAGPDVGLESTVVDLSRRPYRVLRPGGVAPEDLRRAAPGVRFVWKARAGKAGVARSPGLRHRHYQPACRVVAVAPGAWEKTLERLVRSGERIGVLAFGKKIPRDPAIVFRRHFRGSPSRYARNLYDSFFRAEKKKVDVLVVESISDKGVGIAVMDRIRRAGAGRKP